MSIPYPVHIVQHAGRYYLINESARAIDRLALSIGSCFVDWDGGRLLDPAVPHFELRDIPARCHVPLAIASSAETEIVWWQADEIAWQGGEREHSVLLSKQELWQERALPGRPANIAVRSARPLLSV